MAMNKTECAEVVLGVMKPAIAANLTLGDHSFEAASQAIDGATSFEDIKTAAGALAMAIRVNSNDWKLLTAKGISPAELNAFGFTEDGILNLDKLFRARGQQAAVKGARP